MVVWQSESSNGAMHIVNGILSANWEISTVFTHHVYSGKHPWANARRYIPTYHCHVCKKMPFFLFLWTPLFTRIYVFIHVVCCLPLYVLQGMQVLPTSHWRSISLRRYGDCPSSMRARAVAGETSIHFWHSLPCTAWFPELGMLITHWWIWVLLPHVSYAVDSDFPENRDLEQQMEQLSSRSTHEQADSPMGTALTSVLPGFKFLHATAVVHPDAVLGEVNHCCTLDWYILFWPVQSQILLPDFCFFIMEGLKG